MTDKPTDPTKTITTGDTVLYYCGNGARLGVLYGSLMFGKRPLLDVRPITPNPTHKSWEDSDSVYLATEEYKDRAEAVAHLFDEAEKLRLLALKALYKLPHVVAENLPDIEMNGEP